MEASSSLLILTENHTQHSKDIVQQANQPSTNVANFTDTECPRLHSHYSKIHFVRSLILVDNFAVLQKAQRYAVKLQRAEVLQTILDWVSITQKHYDLDST